MVVLQALVEGMVLEVHVVDRPTSPGSVPAVEVYTQFGSQVIPVHVYIENVLSGSLPLHCVSNFVIMTIIIAWTRHCEVLTDHNVQPPTWYLATFIYSGPLLGCSVVVYNFPSHS